MLMEEGDMGSKIHYFFKYMYMYEYDLHSVFVKLMSRTLQLTF